MTFEEYKKGKELTGRSSKKTREEHDRALFVGWYNAHGKHQKALLREINKIIKKP